MSVKRTLRWTLGGLAFGLLAIQLVPYGRDHTNPPVRREPPWDSPRTRELAVGACFDCHSNQTVWPWYAAVAPASWLVQHDVNEGRSELNLSEWDGPRRDKKAREAVEMLRKGEMPPWFYPWATLSRSEREALIRGFAAMAGEQGEQAHSSPGEEPSLALPSGSISALK